MFNSLKIFFIIGFLLYGLANVFAQDATKQYEEIVLPPIRIANPFKTAVEDTGVLAPQKTTIEVEADGVDVPEQKSIKAETGRDGLFGNDLPESAVLSVEISTDAVQPVSNAEQQQVSMNGKKNP
ncbi:hypothetical protein A2V82_00595 [candidate division KSB1 bacterium RBG_16_48_16]|nr:MAG: hypothetical protein A2V82_00595 [candidate division KSB1 bacterium RBG_16_48_16]